jgi:hypothetical protein
MPSLMTLGQFVLLFQHHRNELKRLGASEARRSGDAVEAPEAVAEFRSSNRRKREAG